MARRTSSIRDINQLRILGLLRSNPGVSRAEIVRQSGLGKATVSTIVADLLAAGVVSEGGAGIQVAGAGRPPVALKIDGTARTAIGVELTGSRCLAALTDLYAEPLRFANYPMADSSVETSLEYVARAVSELLHGQDPVRLLGVGVGVPGPVDIERRRVIQAENLGWVDVDFGEMLHQRIGKPVMVVKRQAAGALGEYWHGAGVGKPSLLYISIGTGIGSGMAVRGELYEGASGSAGEIGHVTIDPDGQRCKCGNLGCLETLASSPAVAARTRQLIKGGRTSTLVESCKGILESITPDMVFEAAACSDSLAVEVVREAARYLGIGVATAINLLNPSVVAIGGDVLEAGEVFLQPLREVVRSRSYSISYAAAEIVFGSLGHRAAAIGAATLAIDRFFTLADPISEDAMRQSL